MEKIIDKFYIDIKVLNKDYVARTYRIDTPYRLRVGDMVYAATHYGRGTKAHISLIKDITEEGVLFKDLDFNEEVFLKWEEDGRDLYIEPFPQFMEEIKHTDIAKGVMEYDISVFDIYNIAYDNWGRPYKYTKLGKESLDYHTKLLQNINNVCTEQTRLF